MSDIINVEHLIANDRYIIPIYQRDFAWTASELVRFISDIENARENGDREYYIGSLVAFVKEDGAFVGVDGQQRLTALSLLLTLANKGNINLHYEARESSEKA